jgi:hypothetical protein
MVPLPGALRGTENGKYIGNQEYIPVEKVSGTVENPISL